MPTLIKILFQKSKSPSYDKALRVAKAFDNYTQLGLHTHIIKIDFLELCGKIHNYELLISNIIGWKSTEIYIHGKEINKLKCNLSPICGCAVIAETFEERENHCSDKGSNIWGCCQLRRIRRAETIRPGDNSASLPWYKFGEFDSSGRWMVNKKHILIDLKEEESDKCIQICPFYDSEKVVNIVSELPDFIDTSTSDEYEKVYSERRIPISIKSSKNMTINMKLGFGSRMTFLKKDLNSRKS